MWVDFRIALKKTADWIMHIRSLPVGGAFGMSQILWFPR